jgi:hypothetical protein
MPQIPNVHDTIRLYPLATPKQLGFPPLSEKTSILPINGIIRAWNREKETSYTPYFGKS